jgi:hypothetical protein
MKLLESRNLKHLTPFKEPVRITVITNTTTNAQKNIRQRLIQGLCLSLLKMTLTVRAGVARCEFWQYQTRHLCILSPHAVTLALLWACCS